MTRSSTLTQMEVARDTGRTSLHVNDDVATASAVGTLVVAVHRLKEREARELTEHRARMRARWVGRPLSWTLFGLETVAAAVATAGAHSQLPVIVPKALEERFMRACAAADTTVCCHWPKQCEAVNICRRYKKPPLRLPAFRPFGVPQLETERRCVLCVRKEITVTLVMHRLKGTPPPPSDSLVPYRNAVGHGRDHPAEVCIAFTPSERQAGYRFFVVKHDVAYYEVQGNTAITHVMNT